MERWCRLVVIVLVLANAGAATGSPPPRSGVPFTVATSSAPLLARATISLIFPGFNGPLPFAPVMAFLNASATGGTPPYRFAWAFGDGGTAATQNATHLYALPGTYIAVLSVTDSGGIVATSTVVAMPRSSDGVHWVVAHPDPSLGPSPLSVHFAVTEMGEVPKSYDWAFGDGAFINSSEANHTYARAGTYVARLNVTEPDGVNATYRMTVIALADGPPEALAEVSVVGYCYRDVWNRASFRGFVGGGSPTYTFSWHLGEGAVNSTLQSPTYSHGTSGFHAANLTVTDATGRVATSSVSLIATPPPCPPRVEFPWFGFVLTGAAVGTVLAAIAYIELRRRRGPMP